MNKFLLTLAIAISFAFSSNAQSESYVPFRVHISPFTYVIPNYTKGYGAGAGISIEPAYAINDNFVAGLKLEAAIRSWNRNIFFYRCSWLLYLDGRLLPW
jgi:hypothetical protein